MKQILYKLFEHQYLGRDEARTILQNIAQGKYNDVQVASLITVFLMRNISVEELCGFRDALLEMRVPVDLSEFAPIDIVGTGGDGKNTFNISTAACFTVAGAGIPVVKHGNYGATSVSGASNVMEQHGVKFTSDVDQMRRSMEQCNIAYLHAPLFNPALKAVAPIRKGLAVRTFFNMLGPLVNPVLPTYQLLGVYNLPLLRLYTYTYQESKTKFAVAIQDFTDEIAVEVGFLPDVVQDFRDRSGRIPYRTKFSIIVRFHLIAFGNVCKQFLQCDILCGIGHCFSFQVIHFVLAPDRHWNTPADQRYISFKFRVQVGIISEFNLHLIPGRQQFLQVFSGKVFDTPGKDYFCRVCQHLP